MIGLTAKQRELLNFLKGYVAQHDGLAPSFEEMAQAVGLVSKSNIHRLIEALECRGLIRRIPHRARTIEIVEHLGEQDAVALHPEVRAAAVSYAKRNGMALSTALAIAARAYFVGDKAA